MKIKKSCKEKNINKHIICNNNKHLYKKYVVDKDCKNKFHI